MKRCVDCKHCFWPPMLSGFVHLIHGLATCDHPSSVDGESLVTGRGKQLSCEDARYNYGDGAPFCGPDAKWFEPHGREPGV